MKVGAHPLVVAVALGLLGPGVLSEVEESPHVDPAASRRTSTSLADALAGLPEQAAPERAADADEAAVRR